MQRTISISGSKISYELERKRVKNINLRVRSDGTVYVSASGAVPVAVIEGFLRSRGDFILESLARMAQKSQPPKSYTDGERISVLGRDFVLRVVPAARNTAQLHGGVLTVYIKDPQDAELRKKTALRLLDALCAETVLGLCEDAYPSFRRFGIGYPQIKFRRMKSRWGSCAAAKGILTFNRALVYAPMECIEYVVYHEFTHFLHQNHSKAFYDCLAQYVPDWKNRRKLLSDYSSYI